MLLEERVHDGDRAIPIGLLRRELPASGGGDRIEPRLAVAVGDAPLTADEAALPASNAEQHQHDEHREHEADDADDDLGNCAPREVYFADWDAAGPDDEVCDVAYPLS